MSSTNRGGQRSFADFYNTPAYAVHRLMEKIALPDGVWCDPCAGEGAIIRAVQTAVSPPPQISSWKTVELRQDCYAPLASLSECTIADVLVDPNVVPDCDVIITNPPYRIAQEFVELCIPKARVTAMLLRLNFLASEKRASFMRGFTPDVYVLPNRPSFTGEGTDSIEYAWFVWHGPQVRSHGNLVMLNSTPKDQRI